MKHAPKAARPAAATASEGAPAAAMPPPLRAVMHAGPPSMTFCGRQWQRGVPQTVTPELWAQMQSRGAARLGFALLTEENDHV